MQARYRPDNRYNNQAEKRDTASASGYTRLLDELLLSPVTRKEARAGAKVRDADMIPSFLIDMINSVLAQPLLLGVLLALATFITEDGTLILGSQLIGKA